MSRRFVERRLVLASHNRGKLAELETLLAPLGIDVVSAADLGLPEPEETEDSFVGNAALKARASVAAAGLPALADDSGLACHGLDGAPGIYSARWAGPERDFTVAMSKVTGELAKRHGSFEAADRRAAFVCALCLAWPDGHEETVEARVEGMLVASPRGSHGFGYDPIFVPDGETRTFGEMSAVEKQGRSHRALALRRLVEACFSPR